MANDFAVGGEQEIEIEIETVLLKNNSSIKACHMLLPLAKVKGRTL